MEFFINPLTFKHSLTKWRLFLHALKISPLFPPREIRLPRSIEFHSRNGRNSGYSNERIHRRPTYDSIRFSQGGKKKLISIEISAEFFVNLRRKVSRFFFLLWNNISTCINIELVEYKIFLNFFFTREISIILFDN